MADEVPKWEYMYLVVDNDNAYENSGDGIRTRFEEALNEHGAKGWELVAANIRPPMLWWLGSTRLIFKRPGARIPFDELMAKGERLMKEMDAGDGGVR